MSRARRRACGVLALALLVPALPRAQEEPSAPGDLVHEAENALLGAPDTPPALRDEDDFVLRVGGWNGKRAAGPYETSPFEITLHVVVGDKAADRLTWRSFAIAGPQAQLEWRRAAQPDAKPRTLLAGMMIEELDLSGVAAEALGLDTRALWKDAQRLNVPLLDFAPEAFDQDAGAYRLEVWEPPANPDDPEDDTPRLTHLYEAARNVTALGAVAAGRGPKDPFVHWADRLRARLHQAWVKQQEPAAADAARRVLPWGVPLFAAACESGDLWFARALLDAGLDVRGPATAEWPPLVAAAGTRDAALVKRLLDKGARPDARNALGETAQARAATYGTPEIRALVKRKP